MSMTKLTGLTSLQTDALRQALDEKALTAPDGSASSVKVTATTATFPWPADETHDRLRWAKDDLIFRHGGRRHPVASLHAVIRKAGRLAGRE